MATTECPLRSSSCCADGLTTYTVRCVVCGTSWPRGEADQPFSEPCRHSRSVDVMAANPRSFSASRACLEMSVQTDDMFVSVTRTRETCRSQSKAVLRAHAMGAFQVGHPQAHSTIGRSTYGIW